MGMMKIIDVMQFGLIRIQFNYHMYFKKLHKY